MAARFWVGGTGTWDASTTTNWSATTGGAGGASVPGAADTVTLDGASGGGVVTVNATINVNTITMGAFTGTLDFSANNNNCTTPNFLLTGSGTRTLNLGSGTFTITGTNGTPWSAAVVTGLTFNAGTSTIVMSATTASGRVFAGGGLIYSSVTFGPNTSMGFISITGANTFANFTAAAPVSVGFPASTTTTITGSLTGAGSSGSRIGLAPNNLPGTVATISKASGSVALTYCGITDLVFTGGATFTATGFDLGRNTGIIITEPTGGATGSHMIGG